MGVFDSIRDKMINAMSGQAQDMQAPQDQPKDDQDLVSFVRQRIDDCRNQAVRISHEGIWMTNIAYLLGFDNVFYDPYQRQYRPSSNSTSGQNYVRRNRVHSNLILPGVQNRLARMLKVPPRYDVRPNSMTEEDKEAARLGIECINHIWDVQKIERKRIDLGMWVQQCGHSYIGVCWDDQLGECIYDPQTNEDMGYEGDIRIDVVPAFEGFADPLAKSWDEVGWFARAKVRKLDYFRTHFPERGDLVKEEGVWLLSTQYEMRVNTLNAIGPNSSGTAEQMKGAAIEINYYEKRSQKYKNGRHVIVANGVLLKNDELPCGEIPYAKFDDVVVGGKFYSESLITHARPLQDQYNRTLAKRADWVNKLLAGKYIASRGHNLLQEGFNDQSGEIVEYDPDPLSPPPSALSLPVIPSYAYDESKYLRNELYDLLGLSEVARGQLPSSSIPAVGIQLLLEQDETRMGIEVEAQEHAWARVGMLILKYIDAYYITDRKLKSKGKNLEYEVKSFNGQMLKKNFDVVVVRGSTVPNSKVIQRQEILNLYTQGLLGDPTDPAVRDKVLGLMQFGEIGEVWEDRKLDMSQIEAHIELIENDELPPVDPKDNHILFMVQLNRYRKSDKYAMLSPKGQLFLQETIQRHSDYAVKQMNPQLATPPIEPMPPPPTFPEPVIPEVPEMPPGTRSASA